MKVQFKHENGFTKDGRVFCEVFFEHNEESFDELLNSGWNPSMEEEKIWYQSRSSRINIKTHEVSNQRKNFLKKIDKKVYNYTGQKQIDDFFHSFYDFKKYEIKQLYDNCSKFFEIKILEISYEGEIVGYARFIENEESNLFLNLAYLDGYYKLSLGTNLFHLLVDITKSQNKKYLYIYETYQDIYSYKQNFSGVEIWDGRNWI
jgi:hypothetical protein